ncbi:hypothetical protein MRX96_010379 [Rhipicephalus microplus]
MILGPVMDLQGGGSERATAFVSLPLNFAIPDWGSPGLCTSGVRALAFSPPMPGSSYNRGQRGTAIRRKRAVQGLRPALATDFGPRRGGRPRAQCISLLVPRPRNSTAGVAVGGIAGNKRKTHRPLLT